jgi:hypothetical protein
LELEVSLVLGFLFTSLAGSFGFATAGANRRDAKGGKDGLDRFHVRSWPLVSEFYLAENL